VPTIRTDEKNTGEILHRMASNFHTAMMLWEAHLDAIADLESVVAQTSHMLTSIPASAIPDAAAVATYRELVHRVTEDLAVQSKRAQETKKNFQRTIDEFRVLADQRRD
jgi:two-component sensor histidine kinase